MSKINLSIPLMLKVLKRYLEFLDLNFKKAIQKVFPIRKTISEFEELKAIRVLFITSQFVQVFNVI